MLVLTTGITFLLQHAKGLLHLLHSRANHIAAHQLQEVVQTVAKLRTQTVTLLTELRTCTQPPWLPNR